MVFHAVFSCSLLGGLTYVVRPSTGEERHVFQEQVSLTYPKEACFSNADFFTLLHRLWECSLLYSFITEVFVFLGAAAL